MPKPMKTEGFPCFYAEAIERHNENQWKTKISSNKQQKTKANQSFSCKSIEKPKENQSYQQQNQ